MSSVVPPKPGGDASLVVGATLFGWLFGKDKKWGRRMLRMWAEEELRGGPKRTFLGPGGGLYTTMAVVHQYMPPGRDVALYRRVEALEDRADQTDRRLDRAVHAVGELERRVARVEQGQSRRAI